MSKTITITVFLTDDQYEQLHGHAGENWGINGDEFARNSVLKELQKVIKSEDDYIVSLNSDCDHPIENYGFDPSFN